MSDGVQREQRIQHIVGMLLDHIYKPGQLVEILAADWNVSKAYAQGLVAEARKRVAREIADSDEMRIQIITAMTVALSKAREYVESADKKAVAVGLREISKIAKTYADVTGVGAPQKLTLDGGIALADIANALQQNSAPSAGDADVRNVLQPPDDSPEGET